MSDLDQQITDAIKAIPCGFCMPAKAKHMAAEILRIRASVCVEIGVWGGKSLVVMGLACKAATWPAFAVGIDPWALAPMIEGAETFPTAHVEWLEHEAAPEMESRLYPMALKAIIDNDLQDHCAILRATSERAALLFSNVDFLHIDGNHSELSSCRDVNTWLPKVRPGGVVFFDDTDWQSTKKAMAILRANCDCLGEEFLCGFPEGIESSGHYGVYVKR